MKYFSPYPSALKGYKATRELAIQLTAEAKATVWLKYHRGIVVQNLIGGTKIQGRSEKFGV
jgi:superfamily II DNA/RNA helicase